MLLGDILRRNAKFYPDKAAILFRDTKYSYSMVEERVIKLSNGLKAKGIMKGDRIGILAHPCPEYIELYIAVPKLGAVLVPLNCRLVTRELDYIINDAELKLLILGEEFVDIMRSLQSNLPTVETFFCIGKTPSNIMEYENLIKDCGAKFPETDIDGDDVAVQMYTSGTTGKAKGVMLSHKNLMSMYSGRLIDLKLDKDDIFLSAVPFYHTAAEYALIMLYIGGTLIIHEKFDPEKFLCAIEAEKVTLALGVPSMINFLLQHINEHGKLYDFASIKTFLYGGSPMPLTVLKKAIEKFQCGFCHSYGLTEASPGVTLFKPEEHVLEGPPEKIRRLASCGKEIFNVEARVVNKEGADVKPGEVGEIIVRGDNVMKGYWKLPKETAETIKNGWLHTGDMATVDEEGYIFIVDRKKDMIISGGENIYPREIEDILYSHPDILEAAVIGVPDVDWGEAVKAIIVTKKGRKVESEEVINFCKKNLASYKKPKSVKFVDTLPRNSLGKVLKNELRDKYW